MIDLPDMTILTAVLADPRFTAAVLIAVISGILRGFSGFGAALIYMPLIAAVYDPKIAAVTLLLTNFVTGVPFVAMAARDCNWRDLLPMWIAASAAIPFGTMLLIMLDPEILRWGMAVLVLSLLIVLISGWRFHGQPRLPITIGVGLASGFMGGATQLTGPPVILYWLGGSGNAVTVRANMMVYFTFTSAVSVVSYAMKDLFTTESMALSLLLGVPYLIAMAIGAFLFRGASDQFYRRIAYLIIAAAALVSMPIFDRFY